MAGRYSGSYPDRSYGWRAVAILADTGQVSLVGRIPVGTIRISAKPEKNEMPSTLIAGANRGLGLEFARQYAADGWHVYATCRDPNSASELRKLADANDHKMQVLALGVTDLASIKAAATALEGCAIDLLLNNAGVGGPRGQKIGNIDYEAWAEVLDVNTMGPLRVAEAREGSIPVLPLTSRVSLAELSCRPASALHRLEAPAATN